MSGLKRCMGSLYRPRSRFGPFWSYTEKYRCRAFPQNRPVSEPRFPSRLGRSTLRPTLGRFLVFFTPPGSLAAIRLRTIGSAAIRLDTPPLSAPISPRVALCCPLFLFHYYNTLQLTPARNAPRSAANATAVGQSLDW